MLMQQQSDSYTGRFKRGIEDNNIVNVEDALSRLKSPPYFIRRINHEFTTKANN